MRLFGRPGEAGLLWNIDPTWQAFANISRSAEVPSFGESANVPGVAVIPFTSIRPRNLTNKAYISSVSIINQAIATSPLFEPGNERAVFAGMKYRW